MENKDDDEEINEQKVKNKDVLSEEEIIDTIDMTPYEQRIENIIGRQYSNLFFDFFENIYRSKIKNKISSPLTDVLNKTNKRDDTLWMRVYKSLKFYSKENLPILIIKYFQLKAEYEFKYIYNVSKKYTNFPNKFIGIYIKKMKKKHQSKLNELKEKNLNKNLFSPQSRNNFFIRSFLTKKTIFRSRKFSHKNCYFIQTEKEVSESLTKEEIENKKKMRTEIMRQVHQLKLDAFKEVENGNKILVKQKKKYGGIKSRFFDIFKKPKIMHILNSKSTLKINNNLYKNYQFNKYNESINQNNDYFPYSQRKKKYMNNNSKLSYLSKDNIFLQRNRNFFSNENSSNKNCLYYYTSQNSSNKKKSNKNIFRNRVLNTNRLNLHGYSRNSSTNSNINDKINFSLNKNNNVGVIILSPLKQYINNKTHLFKKKDNFSDRRSRPNSGFNNKKTSIKLFITKLEERRNKEILDDLIYRNKNKDEYNNKIYELFKRTECF